MCTLILPTNILIKSLDLTFLHLNTPLYSLCKVLFTLKPLFDTVSTSDFSLWICPLLLSVLVNTTPLSYFSAPRERAPRRTCLLCPPLLPTSTTIHPAARLTVGSTIKGCAVMKGALAEAIYFPAQCRKVPPVLIFQPGLCVLYSAVMAGTRRTQPAWTNGVKGEGGAVLEHEARVNHVLKSISLPSHFFSQYFFIICAFLPLYLPASLSRLLVYHLPPLPSFSAPVCTPPPQNTTTTSLLSIVPVFILFLWSLLN